MIDFPLTATTIDLSDHQLKEVPKELLAYKQLQHLKLNGNELQTLPSWLVELKELRKLELSNNEFATVPVDVLESLQLEFLNLGSNKITQLPQSVEELAKIKLLILRNNPIKRFPLAICYLTDRKQKELIPVYLDELMALPKQLIQLADRSLLEELVPTLEINANAKGCYIIHPQASRRLPLDNAVINFFKYLKEQSIALPIGQQLFYLLLQHAAITTYNRKTLFELYKHPVQICQKAITRQLRYTQPLFEERPINKQAYVYVGGYTVQSKTKLKEVIEGLGAQYQTDITTQTTHILLGRRIALTLNGQQTQMVYLNEGQLQQQYNQQHNPYLLGDTAALQGHLTHIKGLLLSNDSANVHLGLSLLESLGLPKELMSLVFAVSKEGESKEVRKEAKNLLYLYGSDRLQDTLSNQRPLYLAGHYNKRDREVRVKRILFFAEEADIDPFWMFYYMFRIYGLCDLHLLNAYPKNKELEREILHKLVKNPQDIRLDGMEFLKEFPTLLLEHADTAKHLRIEKLQAKQLPENLGDFQQLETLIIREMECLKELPTSICTLAQLQELALIDLQIDRLPAYIGQLQGLEKLLLNECYHLKHLPDSFYRLANLQHLALNKNGLAAIDKNIGQLKQLRHLEIREYNRMIIDFEGIYQLPHLECLEVASRYTTHVADGISECSSLKVLKFVLSTTERLPYDLSKLLELEELMISCEYLEVLPPNLEQLKNLRKLSINMAAGLKEFPSFIYQLANLEELRLTHFAWGNLPTGIAQLQKLKQLEIISLNITELPSDLPQLKQLEKLNVQTCKGLSTLPSGIEKMPVLKQVKAYSTRRPFQRELERLLPHCQIFH